MTYSMERQLGSRYGGDKMQRERATLTAQNKKDESQPYGALHRGTLAMPCVLEQLPTGRYGMPKGDLPMTAVLVGK